MPTRISAGVDDCPCFYNLITMTPIDLYRITGIIRERKNSRIVNLIQFARKRSRMVIFLREYKAFCYNYSILLLLYSDQHLRTYIHFPTKVAIVETLQSSMHQCSSYSGHTHLQLLDRVILKKL